VPLAHIDFLDASLERVSAEIAERRRPFEAPLERRHTIAGVGRRTAEGLLAELGSDLTRFPSAGHLASWAGRCPGGVRATTSARANAAAGAPAKAVPGCARPSWKQRRPPRAPRDTSLAAQYRRRAARRGAKRAAVAVAHSILVVVSALLTREQESSHDLGGQYVDERDRLAVQRRLVHRLEALGYTVSLDPTTPAA